MAGFLWADLFQPKSARRQHGGRLRVTEPTPVRADALRCAISDRDGLHLDLPGWSAETADAQRAPGRWVPTAARPTGCRGLFLSGHCNGRLAPHL
jgi:hypothetical protein